MSAPCTELDIWDLGLNVDDDWTNVARPLTSGTVKGSRTPASEGWLPLARATGVEEPLTRAVVDSPLGVGPLSGVKPKKQDRKLTPGHAHS